MIIRVKINPLSKWCPYARGRDINNDFYKIVGEYIEINTEVTRTVDCGGRAWLVLDKYRNWTQETLQLDRPVGHFACEHQIEIGD